MAILSGCVREHYNYFKYYDLPEMPKAGKEVASEVEALCQNGDCLHLNDWFNKLYFFRQEYEIYKND